MKFSRRSVRPSVPSRTLASAASASPKKKDSETFDSFGERVHVETYPGWYTKHNNAEALQLGYPTFKWDAWKVSRQPLSYWEKIENRRSFLEWLFVDLKLKVSLAG